MSEKHLWDKQIKVKSLLSEADQEIQIGVLHVPLPILTCLSLPYDLMNAVKMLKRNGKMTLQYLFTPL